MLDAQVWPHLAVAVFTGLLACATFLLARETRRASEADRRERLVTAFRAALVEQVENCRHWYSHQWILGAPAIAPLQGWSPAFDALARLLDSVEVPGPLVAYLVWLMGIVREQNKRCQSAIETILEADAAGIVGTSTHPAILHEGWELELDQFQTIVCLLCAEAARRGLRDVADAFQPDAPWLPWLTPQRWPETRPRTASAVVAPYYHSGPPWPEGEAYAACSPAARDQAAQALPTAKAGLIGP